MASLEVAALKAALPDVTAFQLSDRARALPIAGIYIWAKPRSMSEETYCCCRALADSPVIPMGGNGLDALVFASFKRIEEHGGEQWWLYISTCQLCGQDWMIAQDERIYDNFYLRRLTAEIKQDIVEWSLWPEEFLTYERVLKLGRKAGRVWTFLDSASPALVATAEDLRRERPDISVEEIAYLLGISAPHASSLLS